MVEKLSWNNLLVVFLLIFIFSLIIYYLKMNNFIENFDSNYSSINNENLGNFSPDKISCQNNINNNYPNTCGPLNKNNPNVFSNIDFKPDCCDINGGSSYSNSTGCACLCANTINYLNSRAGNRLPPSIY